MPHAWTNGKPTYGKNAHCSQGISGRRRRTQWRLRYCGYGSPVIRWCDVGFLCLFTDRSSVIAPIAPSYSGGGLLPCIIHRWPEQKRRWCFQGWAVKMDPGVKSIQAYRKHSDTYTPQCVNQCQWMQLVTIPVSSAAHSVMYLSFDSAGLGLALWLSSYITAGRSWLKTVRDKGSFYEKCRSQIHSKKYKVCVCVWSHPELAHYQFPSFFSCSSVTISVLLPVGVTPQQFFVAVMPPKVQLYLHNPDLDGTLLSYFVMRSIKYPLKMTQNPSLLP